LITLESILLESQQHYEAQGLSRYEAELILSKITGFTRAQIIAFPEKEISKAIAELFDAYCHRRVLGEPMAYLFSKREFWGLSLAVNPHVLIPRHETEHLVEYCLNTYGDQSSIVCADLGTGSGAIALALASECPSWQIIAVDKSFDALQVAQKNQALYQLNNVHFLCANWLSAFHEVQFDFIVTNPPYLSASDPHLSLGDLRFEPESALIAQDEGLADFKAIIQQAKSHLKEKGQLIIEHGCDQKEIVQSLFLQAGFKAIKTYQDYSHLNRWTVGS
jgi:release factor glutamine methyltransferase